MKIIEKHQGCSPEAVGCWGPVGDFYTVFGTNLRFLTNYIIIAITTGLILFGVLFFLKKRGKIKPPLFLTIIIPIIVTVLVFFLLAYFFPIRIIY